MTDFCLESRDTRLCRVSQFARARRLRPACSPIILHDITLTELSKEVLVMRDDDKLEVSVVLSFVDDAASRSAWSMTDLRYDQLDKTSRQRVNVLYVEGISRLIKR